MLLVAKSRKLTEEQILHLLHELEKKYKEAHSILDSYNGGAVDHISKVSGLNLIKEKNDDLSEFC